MQCVPKTHAILTQLASPKTKNQILKEELVKKLYEQRAKERKEFEEARSLYKEAITEEEEEESDEEEKDKVTKEIEMLGNVDVGN